MSNAPSFFVPAATPETQESVYAEFARLCGVVVPALDGRVYSIAFRHDGEVWNATVGKTLHGVRAREFKSRGTKVERESPVSDPALVLAIFPGNPYKVVTNHRIAGNVGSRWENPFLAGKPSAITLFSDK